MDDAVVAVLKGRRQKQVRTVPAEMRPWVNLACAIAYREVLDLRRYAAMIRQKQSKGAEAWEWIPYAAVADVVRFFDSDLWHALMAVLGEDGDLPRSIAADLALCRRWVE